MRMPKELLFLFTLFTWGCIASQPIYQAKSAKSIDSGISEQTLYDSAVFYFREKQYDQSIRLFDTITKINSQSDYVQKSAYMSAYLYTIPGNPAKNYTLAKERFLSFGKHYPKSRYRSDSESWVAVITELDNRPTGSSLQPCDSLIAKNKALQEEIKKQNFVIEQLQAAQKK